MSERRFNLDDKRKILNFQKALIFDQNYENFQTQAKF
jgi:hypothetical protein